MYLIFLIFSEDKNEVRYAADVAHPSSSSAASAQCVELPSASQR